MKYILVLLMTLALVGCAPTGPIRRIPSSGIAAPAPEGYTAMCQREPNNPLCGGKHT